MGVINIIEINPLPNIFFNIKIVINLLDIIMTIQT